ncbi:MAG: tRNA lysidine(34) synthetase TilS [Alphaproteobacteria bacterium]|nr:tRNA lysidine(34) synthetase TilS [Alphaproteobacteria bacterium]
MLTARSSTKPLTLTEFGTSLASFAHFEARPFVAVAVSGGPDSLALAILADHWARERGGEICALTVDHGLRPDSGAEIRLLRGWLTARAIRHEILTWSADKPATGIQEAARAARYGLLVEWCREHGCLHLLTAHQREDQAETHMIRRRAGSGDDGLAGMSAIRELADCRILRPLLGVAKARLIALLHAERQPFITDPSNRDPTFERSWLRGTGAVPVGADFAALLSVVRKLGCERAALERKCARLLAQTVVLHPAGFAVLDPGLVFAASDIAERAFQAIVAAIGGKPYPARRERVARLRRVLAGAARRGHTLGGCRFVHWRHRLLVLRELDDDAGPVRLTPGTSFLWDRRFSVALAETATGAVTVGYLGRSGVVMLNRHRPELRRRGLPRLIYPILPAVWDKGGIAAVPHLGYRREGDAALPEFSFRPINPLTPAGFTVV